MRRALKSQYHAGLSMLRQAIEGCPDRSWSDENFVNRFWHVAYHVLFYTDFYLHPNEAAFTEWVHHRPDLNFMGTAPGNPPRRVDPGEPLPRERILEYWTLVDGRVDSAVDALDLDAAESGFWWYRMPKLEHQLVNLRHLQHHTGQLVERVRATGGRGVAWVGK
ncbi:MAG TPA: DinB family protein [Gemmatimonadaceae bacterium]